MPHQLKVTLDGIEPAIWRRIVVPSEFTLYDLHCAIQVVMGWEDCHLHDFTVKRRRYALREMDEFDNPLDEAQACLRDIAPQRTKIRYQYDFGDGWNHVLVVEKITEESSPPVCIDGARACPPEDSGGPWGYAEKLEALANPDDEDGADLRDWMGEDFDPELFEKDAVNRELLALFRPAPRKKRLRRSK